MEEQEDEELSAIKTMLDALKPLKPEARDSVIEYVFRRLGITAPAAAPATIPQPPSPAEPTAPAFRSPPPTGPTDLRSFKEEKQPRGVAQMVAVLAYYLMHLAPVHERRDHIVAPDIENYFTRAKFKLPTSNPNVILVNVRSAGYLDSIGKGKYRLSSVGHNLVAHKLPGGKGSERAERTRRGRRAKG
jgi:hypothetical protein